MATSRKNRRLSLIKNWRMVKKTRKNGEIFYNCQYRNGIGFWLAVYWGGDDNDGDFDDIDNVKEYIAERISKHALEYDEQCGEKIDKSEIIKLG